MQSNALFQRNRFDYDAIFADEEAAFLPPRLGWLVLVFSVAAAALYKLPFGHQIIAVAVYGIIGLWGLLAAYLGRYTRWLAMCLFLAGGETVFRTAFPAGYLLFFYWLMASFLISPHNKHNLREHSQKVTLVALGLLVLLMIFNTFHPDGWFGLRQWGVVFVGVWCGCAVACRVPFAGIERILEWAMAGIGIVAALFLTTSVNYSAGRASGTWEGPGPTAAAAGLGVLLAIYLLTRPGTVFDRILYLICTLGCVATLILTASQGAALATAVSLAIWILQIRNIRQMMLALLIFAAVVYIGFYIDDQRGGTLQGRFDRTVEDGDLSTRQYLFPAEIDGFKERPLLGWGTGSLNTSVGHFIAKYQYRARNLRFSDGHNTVLHIMYEEGMLGLIPLTIVLVLITYRSWRFRAITTVPLFILMVFSLAMGQSTMHKQAPMFIPWFFAMISTIDMKSVPEESKS